MIGWKVFEYGKIPADKIFERQEYITGVTEPVREIIKNVRENGDKAVLAYTEKFDKAVLSSLEVVVLYALLRVLYRIGKYLCIDRRVLIKTEKSAEHH